jgi:hypothetical protein
MPDEYDNLLDSLSAPKPVSAPRPSRGGVFTIQNAGDPSKWSLDVLPDLEKAYQAKFGGKPAYGRIGQGSGVGGWDHRNNVDFLG